MRKKVLRGVRPPRQAERFLRRELTGLVSRLSKAFDDTDLPETFRDAPADDIDDIIRKIGLEFLTVQAMEGLARRFINMIDNNYERVITRQLQRGIAGISLGNTVATLGIQEVLDIKIRENVSLIKSMQSEYLNKVEDTLARSITTGNKKNLVESIKKIGKLSTTRARLIARDQTSKTNSAIAQARQSALGITEYQWETSGDERVRDSHSDNDGKQFKWTNPPATGHPGEEVQCRCTAKPVIII